MRFLLVCAILFAASLAVAVLLFDDAFPEASIDFRYDRDSSRAIATNVLSSIGASIPGAKTATKFDWDDGAKIFLERTVDAEERTRLLDG